MGMLVSDELMHHMCVGVSHVCRCECVCETKLVVLVIGACVVLLLHILMLLCCCCVYVL